MRETIAAIEAEYRRYKDLADRALEQLDDAQLTTRPPGAGNSVATIVWHISGNLKSRFTDLLTSDGEKPWRDREEEFRDRRVTKAEVLEKSAEGWRVLFAALAPLDDSRLGNAVKIRGVELPVREALLRSLAHTSYHVGQIAFWGKSLRGGAWSYLTIPPCKSDEYRKNPTHERAPRA